MKTLLPKSVIDALSARANELKRTVDQGNRDMEDAKRDLESKTKTFEEGRKAIREIETHFFETVCTLADHTDKGVEWFDHFGVERPAKVLIQGEGLDGPDRARSNVSAGKQAKYAYYQIFDEDGDEFVGSGHDLNDLDEAKAVVGKPGWTIAEHTPGESPHTIYKWSLTRSCWVRVEDEEEEDVPDTYLLLDGDGDGGGKIVRS